MRLAPRRNARALAVQLAVLLARPTTRFDPKNTRKRMSTLGYVARARRRALVPSYAGLYAATLLACGDSGSGGHAGGMDAGGDASQASFDASEPYEGGPDGGRHPHHDASQPIHEPDAAP